LSAAGRCPHWLGQPEKDHHTLTATARGNTFFGLTATSSRILPVVGHPDVAGRTDADVNLQLQPAADIAARGEIASPVFMPGGQFSVRKPQSCTIPADALAKFETQMLSFPSTEIAQGA
jgi:hypothetical protein